MLKTHQWKTTWFLKNGPKALTDTSPKRYRDGKQSYEKIWTILWKALYRMSSRKCKFKKTVRYDHRAMLLLLLSLFSRVWLYDPKDGSPPGSSVLGILQARTLKWVAISFSNASKWRLKVKWLSRVRLFVTPRTAVCQAPPSMGFSRQEHWSGCCCLLHHRAMRMAKIFKCWQGCEASEILIHYWWECKTYRHLGRFLQNHT